MHKIAFSLLGYISAVAIGILVLIFGWGLEPQSWGWILGGNITGALLFAIFNLCE